MRISKENREWADARKEQLGDKYNYALVAGNPHGGDNELWSREQEEEYQGSKLDTLPDYPEAKTKEPDNAPAEEAEPQEIEHSPEIQEAKGRVTAYQNNQRSKNVYGNAAPQETQSSFINRRETDSSKYKLDL